MVNKMNMILMVYVKNAFKEFILPALDNANYSLVLHKEIFELEEDIDLSMEVVEQKWRFTANDYYNIKKGDILYFGTELTNGDVLDIVINGRQRATLIVWETTKSFQVFKKYDILGMSEITVGKEESNVIQYDFFGLISRKHARLYKKSNEMVIEDSSSNGIFLNSRKISTGITLKFGDYINIFGLHIIYLKNVLAIAAVNEYRVDETRLQKHVVEKMTDERVVSVFKEKELFHRAPRNIPNLYTEPIKIEAPPNIHIEEMEPLFLVIGSAFSMAIPMLLGTLCSILGMGMVEMSFT